MFGFFGKKRGSENPQTTQAAQVQATPATPVLERSEMGLRPEDILGAVPETLTVNGQKLRLKSATVKRVTEKVTTTVTTTVGADGSTTSVTQTATERSELIEELEPTTMQDPAADQSLAPLARLPQQVLTPATASRRNLGLVIDRLDEERALALECPIALGDAVEDYPSSAQERLYRQLCDECDQLGIAQNRAKPGYSAWEYRLMIIALQGALKRHRATTAR